MCVCRLARAHLQDLHLVFELRSEVQQHLVQASDLSIALFDLHECLQHPLPKQLHVIAPDLCVRACGICARVMGAGGEIVSTPKG